MVWEVYVNMSSGSFKFWSAERNSTGYTGVVKYGKIGISTGEIIHTYTTGIVPSRIKTKLKKDYYLAAYSQYYPQSKPTKEMVLDTARSNKLIIPISRYVEAFGHSPSEAHKKEYTDILQFDEGVSDALSKIEDFF